jgi:hypothetical protein
VRPYAIAFALSLLCTSLAAQPAGEVTFHIPTMWSQLGDTADQQTAVGAGASLEHRFNDERVRAFYEMALDTFGTDEALRTWLHNAGATATVGSDTRAVDVGGSFFWRANEGVWAADDFQGANLVASARLKPAATLTLTGTYAFYVRRFAEEPALSQIEHLGSTRMLANFRSRTTVAAALTVGRKSYDGREFVFGSEALPTSPTLRGGRGWGRSVLAPTTPAQVSGEAGARRQWTWAVRVAQSLDDRTGIWIEREDRRVGGEIPPTIVWTPPLFYEDGVYDDPYVVEAGTWRAGAKHVFASGHELAGWGSHSDRNYAGLERADALSRAGVQAIVPLTALTRASVDAVVDYSYVRNVSSVALENYRASQMSAGLRIVF